MSTRRGFLKLLGLAGPAAVLAPTAMLESEKATNIPKLPMQTSGYLQVDAQIMAASNQLYNGVPPPMRYLGLAQLKNEGDPVGFDTYQVTYLGDEQLPDEDEISYFARQAFGPKPGRWPWPADREDKA